MQADSSRRLNALNSGFSPVAACPGQNLPQLVRHILETGPQNVVGQLGQGEASRDDASALSIDLAGADPAHPQVGGCYRVRNLLRAGLRSFEEAPPWSLLL